MELFLKEVIRPVLENVAKFRESNAFFINEKSYTYREFGECISMIRLSLMGRRCKNSNVGLVLNDDLQTYASIFALWLEGKAYVPLHPNWPLDRVKDIVDQVDLDLILDSSVESRFDDSLVINTGTLVFSKNCLEIKSGFNNHNELAYILFTSGSTGKPKGVQLTKHNVGAFMDSFWKTGIIITNTDRCLQCFDLSFDVSVQGYLVALTKGACCYTVPYGQIKYIYAGGLIDRYKLTFGAMAPSMLRYLKPYFSEIDASSLKTCILTAEACPLDLMEDWFKVAINTDIYDFYGPTECTIYATYYKVQRDYKNKTHNGIISIGKPFANVSTIIIDEEGKEVEPGQKGELCLSGDQLTLGYWMNEEKNRDAFYIKDGIRWYHTGDICYTIGDDIMYAGRLDAQAKIQGFRVELGEIEYHARQYSNVNCVALAFENADNLTEIALFIEKKQEESSSLISYLRTKMPHYMIPSKYYYVPKFPLNGNDKVDKPKLKDLLSIE